MKMQHTELFHRTDRTSLVCVLCLVMLISAWSTTILGAPMNGQEVTLRQPDDTTIKARAFGDEFFYWLETLDGYVVVRDPATRTYCYARLSADGEEYESTGIPVGKEWSERPRKEKDRIQALEKKIRISRESRKEKVNRALKYFGRDRSGRIISPAPSEKGTRTSSVSSAPKRGPIIDGDLKGLALLASFPDRQEDVTVTTNEVDGFLNDVPYSSDGNATSVRGYFKIQSNNKVDLRHIVTDWFVAPFELSHYDVPTPTLWTRFTELIVYRLEQLKADGFDFTQLDGDNNGEVDCISLFYAGGWIVGAWAYVMEWPGFADYGLSTRFWYQVSPLNDPPILSVACHELGHAVGRFPDLYPYDGNAANTGIFGLMSGGHFAGDHRHPSNVCGPMKYQAGWVTAVDVTASGETGHSLNVDGPNVIRYVNPDNPVEYFLFEMRGETGYEGPYGGSPVEVCPSPGLVAYHVKEDGSNSESSIFTEDNPNCDYSTPPRVLVLEDNPQTTYTPWYDDPTPDEHDAFNTGDEVNDTTTPDFAFWSSSGRTVRAGIGIANVQVGTSNLTFSIYNRNPPRITASPRVVAGGGSSTLSVQEVGMVSHAWSKVSGPGDVSFGSPDAAVTTVTFGNAIGSYVLRITMSDGINQIVSEITLHVGWTVILLDDFSSNSLTKSRPRVYETDINGGWMAKGSDSPTSAWTVSGGTLNNSSDKTDAEGEGAVGQFFDVRDFGPVVTLSFDYTHTTANDTLYIHFWGLDGTYDSNNEFIANFGARNGSYWNDDGGDPDPVTKYNLRDGTSGFNGASSDALVALTGSGTYSVDIDIANMGVPGISHLGDYEYLGLAFARNTFGDFGAAVTIDNVSIHVSPPANYLDWAAGHALITNNHPGADCDGDGAPNAIEYISGTEPCNGDDAPAPLSVMFMNGAMHFGWTQMAGGMGRRGVDYTWQDARIYLEFNTNLWTEAWLTSTDITEESVVPGESGTETVTIHLPGPWTDETFIGTRLNVEIEPGLSP